MDSADPEDGFVYGLGGQAQARFDLHNLVQPYLRAAGYMTKPLENVYDLGLYSLGLGYGAQVFFLDRLGLEAEGDGGAFIGQTPAYAKWWFYARGAAGLTFRFSPGFSLSARASYNHYFQGQAPLFQGLGLSLSANLSLGGLRGTTALELESAKLQTVFPVFYSHYASNSLGKIILRNGEDGTIRNLRVSLYAPQFMDQPKPGPSLPSLARGRSAEFEAYALFTENILRLTESTRVSAEIIADYDFLGSPRQARFPETLEIQHRNALTWDDDRKAAAFVSAKDPAVLRYSKAMAGLVRENSIEGLGRNLPYALGLFEGLKLMDMSYVVDPTTPYASTSADATALDYLQYPFQTLTFKGGDCDDLSIMYCAALESVGVPAAFITVPGHILAAFSAGMVEEDAQAVFTNPDELIFKDGQTWIPVEITLLQEDFTKAWQIGAQTWREAAARGQAALLPVSESWKEYQPVGIPGEDTRIALPASHEMRKVYTESLARLAAREVAPKAEALKAQIAREGATPVLSNRLGILYARFGMFAEAKREFERANASGSYAPALTNLGSLMFTQGKYEQARDYYQKAAQVQAGNRVALLGLARSLYESGKFKEASEAYAKAAALDPERAKPYAYLAAADGSAKKTEAGPAPAVE
jgi:hypothetical protein